MREVGAHGMTAASMKIAGGPAKLTLQPTVSPFRLDMANEDHMLAQLDDPTTRASTIAALEAHVKANGGRLMFGDISALFSRLRTCLADEHSNSLVYETTLLIESIAREFGTPDVDAQFAIVTPQLVRNLAHLKPDIWHHTSDLLLRFIQHSRNREMAFAVLLEQGLLYEDEWRVRKAAADFLKRVLSAPGMGVDDLPLQDIVRVLVDRLRDVYDAVSSAVTSALQRLREVIGDEALRAHVGKLSARQQALFESRFGDASSPAAPSTPSSRRSSANSESLDVDGLLYGFIPQNVFDKLKNAKDYGARAEGIQGLQKLVAALEDHRALQQNLPRFLSFLARLHCDANFKISHVALGILEDIVGKTELELGEYVANIIDPLMPKFADVKGVIRGSASRVYQRLLETVSPAPVLPIVLEHARSDNSRLREEVVNLVIATLLSYPRFTFDLGPIVRCLEAGMNDEKTRVKYCALEGFAVLVSLLPVNGYSKMLTANGCSAETLQLIGMRVTSPRLPSLSPDGVVEHIAGHRTGSSQGTRSAAPSRPGTSNATPTMDNDMMPAPVRQPSRSASSGVGLGTVRSFTQPSPSMNTALRSGGPIRISAAAFPSMLPGTELNLADRRAAGFRMKLHMGVARAQSEPNTPIGPSISVFSPVMPMLATKGTAIVAAPLVEMGGSSPRSPRGILSPTLQSPAASPRDQQKLKFVLPNKSLDLAVEDRECTRGRSDAVAITPLVSPSPSPRKSSTNKPLPPAPKSVVAYDDLPVTTGKTQYAFGDMDELPAPVRRATLARANQGFKANPPVAYDDLPVTARDTRNLHADVDDMPAPTRRATLAHANQVRALSFAEGEETTTVKPIIKPSPTGRRAVSMPPQEHLIALQIENMAIEEGEDTPTPMVTPRKKSVSPRKPSVSPVRARQTLLFEEQLSVAATHKQCMETIKNNADWEAKARALDTWSQLLVNPETAKEAAFVVGQSFHDACITVVDGIQNLRSQVSKSGLVALTTMFRQLGKAMCSGGPELDMLAGVLFKKVGEGGGRDNFMTEEVDRALDAMCRVQGVIAPTRVLAAVLCSADHKNPAVRAKVAGCVETLITNPELSAAQFNKIVTGGTELERLLPVLTKYLGEGLADTRNAAKRTLLGIQARYPEFEAVVERMRSTRDSKIVMDVLAQGQSANAMMSAPRGRKMELDVVKPSPPGTSKPKKPIVKSRKDSGEMDNLKPLFKKMGESDWRLRYEAITEMTELLYTYPEDFGAGEAGAARVLQLFDVFMERLRDSNSKVNLYALQTLEEWISVLKNSIGGDVLISLLPVLASNLAAANASVRTTSGAVFDTMNGEFGDRSRILTVQTLSNLIRFGSSGANNAVNGLKVKAQLMEKVLDILPNIAAGTTAPDALPNSAANFQRVISKSILPIITAYAQSNEINRPECANQVVALIHYCQSTMGVAPFYEALGNPSLVQKIKAIV